MIEIDYWQDENGKSYVKNFILDQGSVVSSKLIVLIDDLQKFPLNSLIRVGKVLKLHLDFYDLYEIRLRCNKVWYRFLFVIRDNVAYLLEGFKKQSNKTPHRYIETAIQRSRTLDYQLNQ